MNASTRLKTCRVYLITNMVNGKQYIGFTSRTVEARWKAHVKGGPDSARRLHAAVLEFGADKFNIETIFEGSRDEALQAEQRFVRHYNTFANGYNGSEGGEAPYLGKTSPPEIRAKISQSLIGNKRSLGYRHSEDTKLKMAAAHIGNPSNAGRHLTEEHKENIGKGNTGKKRSDETRHRMSANNARYWKGKHKPDDIRQRVSLALRGNKNSLGHKHSDEARARMSAAQKGHVGAKTFLGRKHSEETKAKMRASALEREAEKRLARVAC